ncbi:FAD-dependent monooxygenase [Spongiactinospora gelatinilytica]|uniref:FAD-dependent monooxygenase n=1 Tax=Spongiactinospora gelatinilytica TaxID=2666298 RepID=UPI0018F459EA|nr:FAD-dependent monooxygenase [Spongiactinospora gelatinilytica]
MNAHDTIVVGAGPVGLWMAAELALGGGRPLVLERAEQRSCSRTRSCAPRNCSNGTPGPSGR